MPHTIRLHRVIATRPEKVYRAFIEPDAIASWIPPYGYLCTVHELTAEVGGRHRMSFRNFTTSESHSFGGTYVELEPGARIAYTDAFDDPNLSGEMRTTITFTAVSLGTELSVEQAGIPDMIPPEACYLGWQDSLDKLQRLVVPDIRQ
ncbi:SRPBCC family protein [Amorphus sp. MBR-141]